jgi:hypothetical protein
MNFGTAEENQSVGLEIWYQETITWLLYEVVTGVQSKTYTGDTFSSADLIVS